ncbi:hypothetical protein ACFPT7_07835 [Acidicapsa dinghuensis]|uniref:Uncharacterized protein n=1 Tax=Acidicapsa dinghuensis TaxID=2218256 RepID=A0ABW1EE01_9BACT|nr:hypothetical protein [Acidicapsa dinghuensis]
MIRNASRKFALAMTLLVLAAPIGRAVAQSSTTQPAPTDPSVITGTNPEPQDDIVDEILALLFFA